MLERRDELGGTWDLFRYPGVRSDSDMHSLGFRFEPWIHDKAIADGEAIREYLAPRRRRARHRPRTSASAPRCSPPTGAPDEALWHVTVEDARRRGAS